MDIYLEITEKIKDGGNCIMSVLLDNSITIYEALEHIKNGKYVMLKKNVYLTVTNKETCKNKCIWLTKYNPKTTKVIVGDTRMVKLSDTRFAILYQTTTGKKNVLNYVVVDNNGKKIYSKKYSGYIMNGSSQPILYEGYIQWASSVYREKKNNYAMMMYQIPANY